jgi:hypothetical protein
LYYQATHQLLVYADDVNILGGSIHAVKKNTEAVVVSSKEIGLEVNAEKTKFILGLPGPRGFILFLLSAVKFTATFQSLHYTVLFLFISVSIISFTNYLLSYLTFALK